MPYALDLVRLAASAILARGDDGPSVRMIDELILSGYRRGLENPLPVILERDHKWLRKALMLPNSERREFWEKYEMLLPGSKPPPSAYIKALAAALPSGAGPFVPKPRSGGTGSLGLAAFRRLCRMAGRAGAARGKGAAVVRLVASPQAAGRGDPCGRDRQWTGALSRSSLSGLRPYPRALKLSPNSCKIEIDRHPEILLSPTMLELMGFEIGNCHSDDAVAVAAILKDLAVRGNEWLHEAARAAASSVSAEQKAYSRAT